MEKELLTQGCWRSAERARPPVEKTVVTISRDEALQTTRTELLRRSGYSVVALTADAEVMKYLALHGRPPVNVILLCHSVPEASRISLCEALKKSIPNAPILMLENGYDPTSAEIDGRIENLHSPEALLDTIQLLISKPGPLRSEGLLDSADSALDAA